LVHENAQQNVLCLLCGGKGTLGLMLCKSTTNPTCRKTVRAGP
jgi:hypothetical protein